MNLNKLGWNKSFENEFEYYKEKGFIPDRVIGKHKNRYILYNNGEYIKAQLAGKFRYKATLKKDFPSVGDWVATKVIKKESKGIIHGVLERKTSFVRRLPISGGRKIKNGEIVGGSPEEQVIASNIDTAFIVSSLDGNFNIQRIERYITLVYNSGANPVIILNKMDLCDNVEKYIKELENIAMGLEIHPISVIKNKNMDIFNKYLLPGKTLVFIGSSGVGKSTITNYLLGEDKQRTKTISKASGKGRHTTTSTEMLFHSSGSMIIDTPGLKELQLWGDKEALKESFQDIIDLSNGCKFNDCRHDTEPGCAVKQAIKEGIITKKRFESYKKQLREIKKVSKEKREFKINHKRILKRKMLNK
ncbi:MAG: ribosome small subunit-dependent GTPase A [Firmicutes bacterium]|nr:ribosome small subunit-dependent GTPase A [Bacillota bacterium]